MVFEKLEFKEMGPYGEKGAELSRLFGGGSGASATDHPDFSFSEVNLQLQALSSRSDHNFDFGAESEQDWAESMKEEISRVEELTDRLGGTGFSYIVPGSRRHNDMFESEGDAPVGISAFKAATWAVDEDHWNPSKLNEYQRDPVESWDHEPTGIFRNIPTRNNFYNGEAGTLKLEHFGVYMTETDAQYDRAEDAQPVSDKSHGALMHAAGVLSRYDAETQGEGIRVENLSRGDAEEVVKAYTVIDSLLDSDSWDQETTLEQISGHETVYVEDGNGEGYGLSGS